jgi:hypothetical protein
MSEIKFPNALIKWVVEQPNRNFKVETHTEGRVIRISVEAMGQKTRKPFGAATNVAINSQWVNNDLEYAVANILQHMDNHIANHES